MADLDSTSEGAPTKREHSGWGETSARSAARRGHAPAVGGRALVVDLDGTLVATDLLIETAVLSLTHHPTSALGMLRALVRGKAAVKQHCAERAAIDPGALPYRPEVLAAIERAREDGRPVYLASASNARIVATIASHLGLFAGWYASDGTTNLAGRNKATLMVQEFGTGGFDYIGNDAADMAVWKVSAKALTVNASGDVERRLQRLGIEREPLLRSNASWRAWLRMLRVHQYAKNLLVFVPLFAAHLLQAHAVLAAVAAFVAFCLAASSSYILNDLVDLQDDRGHRSKRHRPLASGAVPLVHGLLASPLLLFAAIAIAAAISLPFLVLLVGYFVLTTAYSYSLKRKMLVDVIVLAGLYTIRIVGGAVAVNVVVSAWLLTFSIMIFTSLALIKRYVEVAARKDANLPELTGRNYKNSDLNTIAALAAASGFNAITIFTLYISSDAVHKLYARPELLWLIGPLLIYWVARALMMASRGMMHDDPVVFALMDRRSLLTVGAIALVILAAA
ncbi:MAG TPA: UbiA family prenyltransferase [Devosiaceae bacterium]|nr:UbiA family prenyltransferase [Devosiaceae bacterium]